MIKISKLVALLGLIVLLSACGDDKSATPGKESKQKAKAVVTEPVASTKSVAAHHDCQLTFGWDPWEPYQYLTPDDQVKGLEIELVSAIAEHAGCKLRFEQKSWMELLNGIRRGSIDILGSATRTASRDKFAWFSEPYREESFILYIRDGESSKYDSKDLKALLESGFRVGITQDYIYGDAVSALQDDPKLGKQFVSAPMTEMNYYNLLQNNIDGFLEDPFVAAYTIKRKGLQGQIEAFSIEVSSGAVSLMFSKKSVDEKTLADFNKGLATIKADGTYQRILNKYRR